MEKVLWLFLSCCLFIGESKTPKPKTINLNLETVLRFDNKDRGADLHLINSLQSFLAKIKNAIRNPNYRRKAEDDPKLSEFLHHVIVLLHTMDDKNLKMAAKIIAEELKNYQYKGSKFFELMKNSRFRKIMTVKLPKIVDLPAKELRIGLKKWLAILNRKSKDSINGFINFIDYLYEDESLLEVHYFIKMLRNYVIKFKNDYVELKNILGFAIKHLVFDQYSKLPVNDRIEVEDYLNEVLAPTTTTRRKLSKRKSHRRVIKRKPKAKVLSNNTDSDLIEYMKWKKSITRDKNKTTAAPKDGDNPKIKRRDNRNERVVTQNYEAVINIDTFKPDYRPIRNGLRRHRKRNRQRSTRRHHVGRRNTPRIGKIHKDLSNGKHHHKRIRKERRRNVFDFLSRHPPDHRRVNYEPSSETEEIGLTIESFEPHIHLEHDKTHLEHDKTHLEHNKTHLEHDKTVTASINVKPEQKTTVNNKNVPRKEKKHGKFKFRATSDEETSISMKIKDKKRELMELEAIAKSNNNEPNSEVSAKFKAIAATTSVSSSKLTESSSKLTTTNRRKFKISKTPASSTITTLIPEIMDINGLFDDILNDVTEDLNENTIGYGKTDIVQSQTESDLPANLDKDEMLNVQLLNYSKTLKDDDTTNNSNKTEITDTENIETETEVSENTDESDGNENATQSNDREDASNEEDSNDLTTNKNINETMNEESVNTQAETELLEKEEVKETTTENVKLNNKEALNGDEETKKLEKSYTVKVENIKIDEQLTEKSVSSTKDVKKIQKKRPRHRRNKKRKSEIIPLEKRVLSLHKAIDYVQKDANRRFNNVRKKLSEFKLANNTENKNEDSESKETTTAVAKDLDYYDYETDSDADSNYDDTAKAHVTSPRKRKKINPRKAGDDIDDILLEEELLAMDRAEAGEELKLPVKRTQDEIQKSDPFGDISSENFTKTTHATIVDVLADIDPTTKSLFETGDPLGDLFEGPPI